MTEYTHGTKDTLKWMQAAKPEPSEKDLSTQIGVHFEEVAEFLGSITFTNVAEGHVRHVAQQTLANLEYLSTLIKRHGGVRIADEDRIDVLDALADQIVTAVGVGHCAGMQIVEALNEVNRSNFSKFDDQGNPILDNDRKIIKGNNYSKPDLTKFV